jgi:hypothetical protein
MTRAPPRSAISALSSVDPSSTTISSNGSAGVWRASARRQRSSSSAPSRVQMTTLSLRSAP